MVQKNKLKDKKTLENKDNLLSYRKGRWTRYVSMVLIVFVILNLVLFSLGKLDPLIFWIIIIIVGLFAYKVVPKFKEK